MPQFNPVDTTDPRAQAPSLDITNKAPDDEFDSIHMKYRKPLPKPSPKSGAPMEKTGLHTDLDTVWNYGGAPDRITQGTDGKQELSTKEFYYAPGEGQFLARLAAEYPEYFPNRSDDQITQAPPGYDEVLSDSNFAKGQPGPRGDKNVQLTRLPKDRGYPTGMPEPVFSEDVYGGEMIYPLTSSVLAEGTKFENQQEGYTVTYETIGASRNPPVMAVVQDLNEPESAISAPFLILEKKNKAWVPIKDRSQWAPVRPNWPKGRLDSVVDFIIQNVPKKMQPGLVSDTPKPENSNENKNVSESTKSLADWFLEIPGKAFGKTGTFFGDVTKASPAFQKALSLEPKGENEDFTWSSYKTTGGDDRIMVSRKKRPGRG